MGFDYDQPARRPERNVLRFPKKKRATSLWEGRPRRSHRQVRSQCFTSRQTF